MVLVAASAADLTEELRDPHGPQPGLALPVLVRTAFFGASSSEVLIEQQQTPGVEQRCQPSERAQRRRVEIGVERGERHPTDPPSEVVRERVFEVALDYLDARNVGRRARERAALKVFIALGQAVKRVARKDLLPRPEQLASLKATNHSPKDTSRVALEHAELDDVARYAVREARRHLED